MSLISLHNTFLVCLFGALAIATLADELCPPADLISPCQCTLSEEYVLPSIQCRSEQPFDIKAIFAKLSESSYNKRYHGIRWYYGLETAISDYVFGSTTFEEIEIVRVPNDSQLERISPKAFLNSASGRNVETRRFQWWHLPKVSFQEMMGVACSQFEGLEEVTYRRNYVKPRLDSLDSEAFKACSNWSHDIEIRFNNIDIGTIHPYALKHLPASGNRLFAFWDSDIDLIDDFAFCQPDSNNFQIGKTQAGNHFTVDFFSQTTKSIKAKAFLGIKSDATTIRVSPTLLTKEALQRYLLERKVNVVELVIPPTTRFLCDCRYKWLHVNQERVREQIKEDYNKFLCIGETSFWDLSDKHFKDC